MKGKYKRLWLLLPLVFIIIFGISFYEALSIGIAVTVSEEDQALSKEKETAVSLPEKVQGQIFILGDSLAVGTGGTLNAFEQAESKFDKTFVNLAVEGAVSKDLLNQIESLPLQENVEKVYISIGGNDLRRASEGGRVVDEEVLNKANVEYRSQLIEIINKIRIKSPQAKLYVLGLYALDYTPSGLQQQRWVQEFNYTTQMVLLSDVNATFIPTYDLFQMHLDKILSPDGLHPNDLGYEMIGKRISELITPLN